MCVKRKIGIAILGLAMVSLGACSTPQKTSDEQVTAAPSQSQVTQADIAALRAEIARLRGELRNVSQQASNAAARAEAAARAAENAAKKAKASASKSDRIYTESLQK
ncbi:MAG: hypothetical protein IMF05_16815 [Proteobacteria bacterium]|nr:hypothetical protein [Pseudomonadota bacterium]